MAKPPVFIYSSWRTASTWVWKKFRDCSSAYAYYEPYHEVLAEAGIDYLNTRGPGNWSTRNNHPDSAPYFLEFIPLLKSGGKGITGYDSRMGIASMFPAIGEPLPGSESDYLTGLVNLAESQGRIPVFACTRNLGRVASTAKSFTTGVHIVTIRNLWHQWMSYCSQAEQGSAYFLETIGEILEKCDGDTVVARIKNAYNSPELRGGVSDVPSLTLFYAFVGIHLSLYCRAFMRADVVMDINRLERDGVYRSEISCRIRELTGLPVNFDDVRCQIEYGPTPIPTEEDLHVRLPWLMSLVLNGYRIEPTSPVCDHLKRLCDDLIGEIRSYGFYTKALSRSFAQFRLLHDGLAKDWAVKENSLNDASKRAEADARAYRDAQGQEILRLKQEGDDQNREIVRLKQEGDDQNREIARLKQEADKQNREIARLNQEGVRLETLISERDERIVRLYSVENGLRQSAYRVPSHTHLYRAWRRLVGDARYAPLNKNMKRYSNNNVTWHTHLYRAWIALFIPSDRAWHTYCWRAWRSLVGDAKYTPSANGRNSESPAAPLVEPTAVEPCRVSSESVSPALNAILDTISVINDRQVRIDADRANLERSVPVALREIVKRQNELERRLAALESNLRKN